MNKIKNLFKGSSLVMVVAGLVIAGVASAAIVSFISNASKATVAVKSPVEMSIYEGVFSPTNWTTGQTEITLTSTGGSSMPFTTIAKNNANSKIGGYYVTIIDAGANDKMTGKEFSSIMFDKNKGAENPQNGDIINKLCVVKGDGTLMTLSAYIAAGYSNQKLALLLDIDGDSTQEYTDDKGVIVKESTGMCSPLTPYIGNETRSFFHLDAGEIEKWTFTPTWNTGAIGNFTIYAQYVNDLKAYAAYQYGL
jgi:hypothetical protein